MAGRDLSEFQDPRNVDYYGMDFAIIRVSHDTKEDKQWRAHVWCCGVAHKPIGFYHALETANVEAEAHFFAGLINAVTYTYGCYIDAARGDLPSSLISTGTMDRFRSVIDAGIYVNGSALDSMPEYKRFERIWFAGSKLPARWLMWQSGQNVGIDVDWAADLGGILKPQWSAFNWPNP